MTTLADLLTPTSEEDANAQTIGILQALGFPSTSWPTFAIPRLFIRTVSRLYSSATERIPKIAAGGFLDTAAALVDPSWLRLLAKSAYDIDYDQASALTGRFQLADIGGVGPTSIAPGDVVIQTGDGRFRYTNTEAATIPLSGVASVLFVAESPGSGYNIASDFPGLQLVTTLPGIAVTNPIPIGQTSWIVVPGTDDETNTLLVQRCRTKWATLGTGGQRDAYVNWARTASPNITRVDVDDTNPDGPGTVRVVIATDAGPADVGTVGTVDAYIQARRALTATVSVASATGLVVTVTGVLYVPAANAGIAIAKAVELLSVYVNGVSIGGTVYFSSVISALMAQGLVRNVESVTINSVAGDVVLSGTDVPTLDVNITTKVF